MRSAASGAHKKKGTVAEPGKERWFAIEMGRDKRRQCGTYELDREEGR